MCSSDLSSFPHHRPTDHTCLHNCFLPSASSDFYDSSLLTHRMLRSTPILFFSRTYFSFLAITHPSHVIGPLTTLVFIIASFHPLLRTSLTHPCLLICTSSRFHCILPCSFCFVIIPELSESQVYKPSTHYVFL